MTKEEVLEFVTKNPVFSLATIDGSRPRVRMMMLYKADADGIIFCTGRDKAVCKQLQSNPAAELCFYNEKAGRQVRIEGAIEMLDDLKLKKKVVEAFPFLKPWVESAGYEVMIICRLQNAKATTWTMETNFDPKQYIQL
jgi:pyridoxamine 5'-phosphate oxidase